MLPLKLQPGFCSGFILTGGQSSRMGQDKALMPVNGRPLALHVADQVRRTLGHATLVGSKAKYAHLGLPVIEDVAPGRGPISGVHAALKSSRSPLNLVVGCDMPFLNAEFLVEMLHIAAVADAQVTVAESVEFGFESLCAVYSKAALGAVESAIQEGEHKLSRLYERLHVRKLSPEEWSPFNPHGVLFANVNTPEDFEIARKRLEAFTAARSAPAGG